MDFIPVVRIKNNLNYYQNLKSLLITMFHINPHIMQIVIIFHLIKIYIIKILMTMIIIKQMKI